MVRSYILAALALVFMGLSVSACSNTLDGMGRDIQNTGQKIEDTF